VEGGGVSTTYWDVVIVAGAVFAALVGGWYYVAAVIDRDRTLARLAAGAFFLFTIMAVLYFWRFF
jgi:hypothetical protein